MGSISTSMGRGDNLIIGETSAFCSTNIGTLNIQSGVCEGMSATIGSTFSDPNIAGAGFSAAATVGGGIQQALMMMRAVNDLDVMDLESLMSGIGGEDLIGEEIISGMEEALAMEEEYEALAAAYASMAASAPPELAGFYEAMAKMYEQMAQIEHTVYEYWEGKRSGADSMKRAEATAMDMMSLTALPV